MEVKYKAGYAKSGRSSCHSCKGVIALQKLRLGKNTPSKFFDGYQLVWYHPACLVNKDRKNIKSSDNIEGFEHIKFADQQYVRKLLGESPGVQDEQVIANNKVFWEVKSMVNNRSLQDLKQLLEYNGCPTTGGNARLVFKCTEGIVYGVTTCAACGKTGLMNYAKGTYTCEAVNDWGKCGNVGDPKSIVDWKFPPTIDCGDLRKYKRIERSKNSKTEADENGGDGGDENEEENDGEMEGDGEEDGSGGGDDGENEEDEHGDEDDEEGEEGREEGDGEEDDSRESSIKPVGFSFGSTTSPVSGFGEGNHSVAIGFGSTTTSAFDPARVFGASVIAQDAPALFTASAGGQPLSGLTFAQAGRLSLPKRQLVRLIRENGGTYSSSINHKVDFVLTTAAEVERGRRKIRQARELQLAIVLELFVHRMIATQGPFDQSPYILQQSTKVGGAGPKRATKMKKSLIRKSPIKKLAIKKPAKAMPVKKAIAKPFLAKAPKKAAAAPPIKFSAKVSKVAKFPKIPAVPKSLPAQLAPQSAPFHAFAPSYSNPSHGGSVDPESKCSSPPARIFVEGSDVYNVMMNQTDIMSGVNKYFKLQLIDANGNGSKFVFFAKWGRVGTDVGASMNKVFSSKQPAIAFFADKFKDKSGNEWSDRKNLVKKPGKYLPIDMETETEEPLSAPPSVPPSHQPAASNVNPVSKKGAKVDAHSKHAADAHVLVEDGVVFDAMLNQTNISANNNKFYVIQVLESNDNRTYWIWNRWGRVGEVGQSKIESSSKNGAIASFKKKFYDKTVNAWEQRNNFKPIAGKYTMISMEYDDESESPESPISDPSSSVKSTLASAVHDLVNMIFDVRMMNQTLTDLNIDVKKMPLGKISKSQILKGYDTLTQIDLKLKQSGSRADLAALSSQFYTIVPHDFGRRVPEIIDNINLLKLKMKQIDTLIEIQVAAELLQQAAAAGIHPTDAKYNKLGTKIEVLPAYSQDFEMIRKYLTNTYEEPDSPYTLELENVFVIERQGEDKRFESFSTLHNRQLLWHGSRLSNWVGIISQGLRIAPPEAPKTGYMFGKGVYFGDMVAKSAEYCFTTPTSNTGLLLLSKVALGASYELTQPKYMEQPPENYHSCHALAKTMPDPSDSGVMSDAVTTVPFGRGVPSNVPDAFLSHGEYVVYNVAQINMKYLLRVKFHHKPGFVAKVL